MKPEDITPELLDWLKHAAESGAEFVQTQAPLLASEIVAWHFWSSILAAIALALVAFILIGIGTLVIWACVKSESSDLDGFVFGIALIGLGIVVLLLGGGFNVAQAVKAKVAPRVVILQYIKGATK